MLKIHEYSLPSGELASVFLRVHDGQFEIVDAQRALSLPARALKAVMAKYGAPFDAEARIALVAELREGGVWIRHVRHLAGYDVIARDYLVYEDSGEQALCALAAPAVGALLHLARAAAPDRSEA